MQQTRAHVKLGLVEEDPEGGTRDVAAGSRAQGTIIQAISFPLTLPSDLVVHHLLADVGSFQELERYVQLGSGPSGTDDGDMFDWSVFLSHLHTQRREDGFLTSATSYLHAQAPPTAWPSSWRAPAGVARPYTRAWGSASAGCWLPLGLLLGLRLG